MSDSSQVLLASLLSGLIGVFLTIIYYSYQEQKRLKVEVLRRLLSTRHFLIPGSIPDPSDRREFFRALNEAMIVFHNDPQVTQLINEFQQAPSHLKTDKLAEIFEAMMCSVGMHTSDISRNFLKTAFIDDRELCIHLTISRHGSTLEVVARPQYRQRE